MNSTPNFGIVAITTGGPITAVLLGYNGIQEFRREKTALYSLCGNRDASIDRCSVLGIGTHLVNATLTNTQRSYIVSFQIVYETNTKSPSVPVSPPITTKSPVRAPTRVPVIPAPVASPIAPVKLPTVPVITPQAPVKPPSVPVLPPPVPVITPPVLVPVLLSPVNVPTPGRFMSFTLIYSGNNTVAAQLVNGMVIDISSYPSSNFNIRVDTINTAIKSVLFLQNNRVEVSKPWAYCGNVGELYNSCSDFTAEGTFTVTVRSYSDANPQLTVVSTESMSFTIVGKPSSTPPIDKFPILINAGGPTIVDSENRTWITDTYFTGGSTYSNSQVDLVNTENDIIYQSERFGNFIYEIPIPRASYSVILHFAEI